MVVGDGIEGPGDVEKDDRIEAILNFRIGVGTAMGWTESAGENLVLKVKDLLASISPLPETCLPPLEFGV